LLFVAERPAFFAFKSAPCGRLEFMPQSCPAFGCLYALIRACRLSLPVTGFGLTRLNGIGGRRCIDAVKRLIKI